MIVSDLNQTLIEQIIIHTINTLLIPETTDGNSDILNWHESDMVNYITDQILKGDIDDENFDIYEYLKERQHWKEEPE